MNKPQYALKHGGLRIFVTGGRAYEDRFTVWRSLDRVRAKYGVVCLISGHCEVWDAEQRAWVLSGADRWAEEWAETRGVPVMPFPVSRGEWKTLGKKAGPLRNRRAVDEGCPDICVHFPGDRGTQDAYDYCGERGVLRWNPLTNEVT